MSFRDILWGYPVNLKKLYFKTAPASYIVVFSSLVLALVFLCTPFISSLFKENKTNIYTEGVIGKIENLNPLYLTSNQVERDIESLIFTKFIDVKPDGSVVPKLAKWWSASSDNLSYEFEIYDNFYFSDGENVTADDVVYTFEKAKELASKYSEDTFGRAIPNLKVEKIGEYKVRFVLDEVNATFFESIGVYIAPKHILEQAYFGSYALTYFGEMPVGSGPYAISKVSDSEVILERNQYYPTQVNIPTVVFRFFGSVKQMELAFRIGEINGMGAYDYDDIDFIDEYGKWFKGYSFELANRKKILFFNLRKKEFANSSIRKGISMLIDKEKFLSDSGIDGTPSKGPISKNSWAYIDNLLYNEYSPTNAAVELRFAGYLKDVKSGLFKTAEGKVLTLTLTYLDNDLNKEIAETLKRNLEKEGVIIELVSRDYNQMTKEVLASRDFELVLYEVEVSIDPDQYDLWHSLKINYPDLNISGYKVSRVDIYLERGRQLLAKKDRLGNYENFQKAMINDSPAIFLYEPKFYYIVPSELEGFEGTDIRFPQDRFEKIANWQL